MAMLPMLMEMAPRHLWMFVLGFAILFMKLGNA